MSDDTDNKMTERKESVLDFTHETTKFLASLIPIVGYLHAIFVKSPVERRLVDAIESLGGDLEKLEQQHSRLTIKHLSNNPVFITAVSNILLISIREHREEKLTALRNIALNTALPNDVDEDIQLMFVQMVDDFTTWHLKLLSFFSAAWWEILGYEDLDTKLDSTAVADQIMRYFPRLNDKAFFYRVVNDLSNSQLLIFPELSFIKRDYLVLESSQDLVLKKIKLTLLGEQFVTFITNPIRQ